MNKRDRPTIPDGLPGPADQISQETSPPPLDGVPWLMMSHAEVMGLVMDHREGFLLSLIDGRTSIATLIDLAAMPRHKVLIIIGRWLAMGVVALHESGGSSSGRRTG
jgi:hypothetical protein